MTKWEWADVDEEIESLLVKVRADTSLFARDVTAMRGELEGPFAAGVARAGNVLEGALVRALRTGKLGFQDLKRVALSALAEIAAASLRSGLGSLFGGKSGGIGGGIARLLSAFLGAPGKAVGGPVSPGRAYLVGERGPELFVPTASGRIEASARSGQGRDIRVSISINAPAGGEARALGQSSRQVARAVKAALLRAED